MRYSLLSSDGAKIDEAPTAQKAADIAMHRTMTVDTYGGNYPVTAWRRSDSHMLGEPFHTVSDAARHLAKVPA
jgi:hypothetical protein